MRMDENDSFFKLKEQLEDAQKLMGRMEQYIVEARGVLQSCIRRQSEFQYAYLGDMIQETAKTSERLTDKLRRLTLEIVVNPKEYEKYKEDLVLIHGIELEYKDEILRVSAPVLIPHRKDCYTDYLYKPLHTAFRNWCMQRAEEKLEIPTYTNCTICFVHVYDETLPLRTVRKGGMRNSNVLFLELNVDVLIQLTYPENLSDAGYHFLKGELSPHKERGATSGCDRISQSNEAYLSFEGDTNTEITEENTDIEYPLCSYQAVERAIRIQISYDALKNDHPYDRRVEEILGLILDVMVSTAPKLRINREEKDIEIVKAQFAKLTKDHVEFVLQSMDDTSTKARNIRAVLLTALYNSVNTINSYYGNRYHFHLAEETRREMEETD